MPSPHPCPHFVSRRCERSCCTTAPCLVDDFTEFAHGTASNLEDERLHHCLSGTSVGSVDLATTPPLDSIWTDPEDGNVTHVLCWVGDSTPLWVTLPYTLAHSDRSCKCGVVRKHVAPLLALQAGDLVTFELSPLTLRDGSTVQRRKFVRRVDTNTFVVDGGGGSTRPISLHRVRGLPVSCQDLLLRVWDPAHGGDSARDPWSALLRAHCCTVPSVRVCGCRTLTKVMSWSNHASRVGCSSLRRSMHRGFDHGV